LNHKIKKSVVKGKGEKQLTWSKGAKGVRDQKFAF